MHLSLNTTPLKETKVDDKTKKSIGKLFKNFFCNSIKCKSLYNKHFNFNSSDIVGGILLQNMKSSWKFQYIFNLKNYIYKLKKIIVVQLQMSQFSPIVLPCHTHTFHPTPSLRQSLPCYPCTCVLYTCYLTWLSPFLTLLSSSTLPSGYCQVVLYFHGSGCILLACFVD